MRKLFFTVLWIQFAVSTAQAGLFRAESETLTNLRDNAKFDTELPIYEIVSTSYVTEKRDFEFNSNFSLLTDPTDAKKNEAQLYILDAKFTAIPNRLYFKVGRSLDSNSTIGIASIDLLSVDFQLPNQPIHLGAFVGIQHQLEAKNSLKPANLSGVKIEYLSPTTEPYSILGKLVQKDYQTPGQENELVAQVAGKKTFSSKWSPELLIDTQYNTSQSNLERLEAGVDLYPSILSFAKIRFQTFDLMPTSGMERPIYSIFSAGRLYEGRFQYEHKLSQTFTHSISFFYDEYQAQTDKKEHGIGTEYGSKWTLDHSWKLGDTIYVFRSYGGTVYGNRTTARKVVSRVNEFFSLVDLVYYEKITSSKRGAVSSELGWSHLVGAKLKFDFSGQADSNNVLRDDFRLVAKLTYLIWDEI